MDSLISIHVPAWGTTRRIRADKRLREISIHVPAWGTTQWKMIYILMEDIFQSTFPRGERLDLIIAILTRQKFQSTFPRGERRLAQETKQVLRVYFNPRSRVGNDDRDFTP